MTFDQHAAEQLAMEAAEAMQEVARRFTKGLQDLVNQAAAEAARERQRLQEESTALARERQRLEEAWQHLNVERARIEAGPVSSGHKPSLYPSPRESQEEATLTRSPVPMPQGLVPSNYIVTVGDRAYTVLPLKEPEAMSLGHELWNHVVEVPEGWEVLSSQMENFHQVMSVLGQHRWGAMVLGVRNARRGFDAYWTPLFGDGSFAAQLCEADVDWIEPAGQEAPHSGQQELRRFRMTYSGLRLVIRKAHGSMMTSVKHVASGAISTPRMAGPMQVHHFTPGAVYNGAGYRILSIVFNPNGTRCVTTDNNGVVGVWKTDQRGLCNQMCHYRKSGAHDKVIFRTATPTGEPNLENPPFFFGGEQGIIYLADDFGLCSERYKIGSPLLLLEYYREKDVVVLVTKSVILVQFSLSADGKVTNESKLKLSCGPTPEKLQGCWAGPGLLATCSHESILRIWNLADDENYILSLQGIDERNSLSGDKVTSVDYNPRKQVLACGTRGGRMVQWRSSTLSGVPKSESNWQVLPVVSVGECAVDKLTWGPGEGLIHARTERSSVILSEAQLNTAVQAPLMAVQSSPMEIIVYHTERQVHLTVTANYRVKGLGVGPSTVLLWNNKNVTLYDVDVTFQATVLSSFGRSTEMAAAALICQGQDRSIAIASGSKIEITNSQGVVQKTIQFSEEVEGYPVSLDVSGGFLVASTSMSFLKLWNVSKSTPKQLGATRKFEGFAQQPLGEIRSVRVNKDGTRVSLLVDQRLNAQGVPAENGTLKVPDARIFVYDTDSDNFLEYQVGQSCVPVAHFWDSTDARLLCCEVVPQALAYSEKPMPPEENKKAPSHCAITLFIATSEQILLQDNISCIDPENHSVTRMPAGLIVPRVYFSRLGTSEDGGDPITKNVLRDFAGLENMDEETTAALLNFSYHLACGNTDEAYKSVKGVRSSNVWESMSKMCVKTGRLDVAQKCLGQMSHARAAGALRQCPEQEPEARLAVVAVHLDMIDDAEQLLKQCGRYDLLNQLYQASGNWEKALDVAKTKDRIHLKPTHYAYAQHLEALEDVEGALTHYEFSGTYRTESPRLLCSMGMTEELGNYVEKSDDSHLHRWYAQFLESKADLDGAAREYTKANDWLSLCRVACFNEDLDRAQKICEDSQDQAACYHLARHLEAAGHFKEAMHYFQLAGRSSHAIRLAQENQYDGDLMSLALSSDPSGMAQAAKYYEQKGQPSKAVILYQKSGQQKRALELCFSARLFDALRKISDELNAESDPTILAKCAEFFMQHEQHDKAVHLLSISKQFDRAVQLCAEHDVQITEDMAERMTPEKNSMEPSHRAEILQEIGKLCRKQGSFQLACKKFTQAGDKLKAMKSLLNSNDTEKIIFFAGTARQPEIYILAGNYLQSLDWHNDPEIMKNIIQFYSKAKAFDKLAAFYDACAQVEIDEYRDYDKAGGALKEALKYMTKAAGEGDERVISLQSRITLVDQFANVRQMAKTEPDQMVAVCERMVDLPDIESAVRMGDIFAQLVEYYGEMNDYNSAHRTVERMRQRGIVLTPYLDRSLLETIYRAVGQPLPEDEGEQRPAPPDEMEEEIPEED